MTAYIQLLFFRKKNPYQSLEIHLGFSRCIYYIYPEFRIGDSQSRSVSGARLLYREQRESKERARGYNKGIRANMRKFYKALQGQNTREPEMASLSHSA